jgi:hypothetical protein
LLKELRETLGVKRLHANELGVARLTDALEKTPADPGRENMDG